MYPVSIALRVCDWLNKKKGVAVIGSERQRLQQQQNSERGKGEGRATDGERDGEERVQLAL